MGQREGGVRAWQLELQAILPVGFQPSSLNTAAHAAKHHREGSLAVQLGRQEASAWRLTVVFDRDGNFELPLGSHHRNNNVQLRID